VNQIDSYLFSAESKKMDIIPIYPEIKINLRREKMKKYKVLNSRQKNNVSSFDPLIFCSYCDYHVCLFMGVATAAGEAQVEAP
jgi:hypothetical protein